MPPQPVEILVVDDHADTLKYISRYLRQRGFGVREAADMESALREVRHRVPGILLSDVGLPDGDGWLLLETLRSEGLHPYAISMSGFGVGSHENRSLAAGYRHHLIKPFLLEDLERLLAEA